MQLNFSDLFINQLNKAPKEIIIAFRELLELFVDDEENTYLRNHALREDYSGHRSINITNDWRAIFTIRSNKKGEKVVLFKFIGTHKELYRS